MTLDKYFKFFFNSINIFFFFCLIVKIFLFKFLKKKSLTAAGACYFFSILFFLLCEVIGLIPIVYNDLFKIFLPLKSFMFISALVYLQIFFYKMAKGLKFKNSIITVSKNYKKRKKAENNTYIYTVLLFIIEVLCVPLFSNSKCNIRFYEVIPAICLLISLIYQSCLFPKIENNSILIPWIIYTSVMTVFLLFRFIIENFVLQDYALLNIISVFFRIIQIFILGYILFIKTNDMEVSLK